MTTASFPQSHNVALVPNPSGYYSGTGVMPTSDTGLVHGFNQFTFHNLAIGNINSTTLASYDTVVLLQICNIQSVLTQSQKNAINTWIQNGGKLIIYDSDACSQSSMLPDYSWLVYPFTTNNPGQLGSNSGTLTIVENNTLSSNDPTSPYYINSTDLSKNTDAVGDSNVMVTKNPNWYGDMLSTNANGVSGWSHTYASYGSGLILYNGLDTDYIGSNVNLQKIWLFELLQPWNPDGLPHGVPVNPTTTANYALPLVPSTSVTPTVTPGPLYAKTPVVLAEVTVQVNIVTPDTLFPTTVLEIKDIKNRLKITQCRLVMPTNKLFIRGFVRKNIRYATPIELEIGETSIIQSLTIDVPFSVVADLTGKYLAPPTPIAINTRSEFEYFSVASLTTSFPAKDRLLSGELSEFNQVTSEYFHELPYCELISVTFTAMDEAVGLEGMVDGDASLPLEEQIFTSVEEKMVVDITLKLLQLQQAHLATL